MLPNDKEEAFLIQKIEKLQRQIDGIDEQREVGRFRLLLFPEIHTYSTVSPLPLSIFHFIVLPS